MGCFRGCLCPAGMLEGLTCPGPGLTGAASPVTLPLVPLCPGDTAFALLCRPSLAPSPAIPLLMEKRWQCPAPSWARQLGGLRASLCPAVGRGCTGTACPGSLCQPRDVLTAGPAAPLLCRLRAHPHHPFKVNLSCMAGLSVLFLNFLFPTCPA